jgi:hypothetical protein
MASASFSAEFVVAGLTSEYGMLWLLVSLLGLYMMTRPSLSRKKSDKAPHSATMEDCVSYTKQMLSRHLSEEHYMFLLASKLQVRGASHADELHFAPGEPRLNFVERLGLRGREAEPNTGRYSRNSRTSAVL